MNNISKFVYLPVADNASRALALAADNRPDVRSDVSRKSRPQSADSSVELSTSFARESGNIPYMMTSRPTASRSRDVGGQRSRVVPPRTCVQRQQPRDPTTGDGTQVNAMPN